MSLDLDAIKARAAAASPGPWENGEPWLLAGVNPDMFGPGNCAYCRGSDPAWRGRADINGTVMDAHRHRDTDPYGVGWKVSNQLGVVADDITSPADTEFIRNAREDIPALVAEVERLRALPTLVEALDALPATNHEYEAWMREHGLGHGAGIGAVIGAVRADLRKLAGGAQ